MKIVIVGKAPPLQGGVSVRTLTCVRSLAKAGHQVTYITNASSSLGTYLAAWGPMEDEYLRQLLGTATLIDVRVPGRISHIPFSPAFETRLLGHALEATNQADIVVGWYYQPYGVVAALAGALSGKRSVVMHAGSDLGRLCKDAALRRTYRATFAGSTMLAGGSLTAELISEQLGLESKRILRGAGTPQYFNRRVAPLVPAQHQASLHARVESWALGPAVTSWIEESWGRFHRDGPPIVGVYGKAGEQKGHFDLLNAAERLLDTGVELRLAFATGGHRRPLLRLVKRIAQSDRLRDRCVLFPFVAPWHVPRFIKGCDIMAFLERDFEVPFHGPRVPLEVMAMAKPLILSREVANKQWMARHFKHLSNIGLVENPRDTSALSAVLRSLIVDPAAAKDMGVAGYTLYCGRSPRGDGIADAILECS